MRLQSIRLALVAGAALAVAGFAQAGTTVDISKLGPKQQAHLAQILAKKSEITPQYNYDIKPAVLKRIRVGSKVNAGRKNAQAVVSLVVTDNLSGVDQVSVTLMSPSGQTASASWSSSFDVTRNDLQIGVDMFNATENGTWRVYSVYVADANGYATYYDEAALAGMGSTTLTVSGATGDFLSPVAQLGGTNLTPTVSRSTPPRGLLPGSSPRVGVQLKLADNGSAGISSASMEFCLDGGYWDCFYLQGSVSVRGKTDVALTVGGYVEQWMPVGNYLPTSLYIYDQAGNTSYFYANWGDDLNALLDNPVITITE